jgi:peroxiredoxin/outer membrane lipoprotein-sorting protein
MKNAKSMTFTAVFTVDGRGKEMFGTIEAKVAAVHGEKGWSYRTTGKGRRTAKAPEAEFDILYSDGNASWLDKDAKRLMNKPVASARGKAMDTASNLRSLQGLFQTPPLSKERGSKDLTLRDSEKVGGTDCDVVVAASGSAGGDMVIYLGKQDHLVRQIVSERTTSAGTTKSILEFKDFKLNDTVPASAMEIALPEGFTKEEAHQGPKPAKAPETGKALPTPKAAPTPEGLAEPAATMPIDGAENTAAHPGKPDGGPGAGPAPSPAPAGHSGAFPAFDLKTTDGQAVTNETIRGQPAVVVFMGTWSMSSRKALPEIKGVAERYKDKARVYVAAVRQRDPKDAKKALTDAGVDVPVLAGADKLAEQARAGSYPAVYVIGADGDVLKHPTTAKVEELFAEVRAALDAALGMAPAMPPALPTQEDHKTEAPPDASAEPAAEEQGAK